jgi:two-component system phosphate regulon sensor histidine kinase PhoR
LLKFDRALREGDFESFRYGEGIWPQLFARFSFLKQRSRKHKRAYRQLLREVRESTNAMPDGGIVLNSQFEIVLCNRAAQELLNLQQREDRGQRVDNLVRDPLFIEYLKSGMPQAGVEIPSPAQSGKWLLCRVVPYGGDQQLLLVRDITERRRLATMRREFVANASHELRSPLTVVSGYLDSLAEDTALDPAWHEPVKEMQRQSDRMRSIVQDLLELSRLEAGGGEAESEPVDVAGMLGLMRKEVLSRRDPPAEFSLQVQSDAVLLGAESELHSIFHNLVSNAVKYTPREGRISVRFWTDAAGGHVSVADTGIGIPASHIPRLTERFYRVDAGRSRKMGGSGLGLAIVKHALQRHGATLEILSEEGKGSTFTCHFPAARVARRAMA